MPEIVRRKSGHPLSGTWRHSDRDYGTTVQFTIRAAGTSFDVQAIDTMDGERLSVEAGAFASGCLAVCLNVFSRSKAK